jgi:hypothetical protein
MLLPAVPGNRVDNSDLLKALSAAVASSVGKPEKVCSWHHHEINGSVNAHLWLVAMMPTCLVRAVHAEASTSTQVIRGARCMALTLALATSAPAPQWVMCSVTTDKPMIYSGTEEPCAFGELISIGAIGGEKNKAVRGLLLPALLLLLMKMQPSSAHTRLAAGVLVLRPLQPHRDWLRAPAVCC